MKLNFTSATAFILGIGLHFPLLAQLPYTSSTAVPWHLQRTYEVRENWALNGMTVPLITSGTGVTWDFTSFEFPGTFEHDVYFEPASATPFHSTYPTANVCSWETDADGNSDYNYFNNSPFELRLIGGVHVEDGEQQNFTFCPNPFLIMDYPMSLGSGVQHQYDCPGGQGEIDDWVIMATGTVLFNGGSIENIVMWRSVFNGPGYSDTSYFWTQPDNVLYPVVRYHPGTSVRIRKPISEEVLNTADIDAGPAFSLFPNPAAELVSIQLEASVQGSISVVVYDAVGRTVIHIDPAEATQRIEVPTSDLAPGSYTVEIRTKEGAIGRRRTLVKQ